MESANEESGGRKRRRTKTSRYNFDFMENEDQRLLQQAIKISKIDVKRVEVEIPEAPVYYPSVEEFADAISYVRKIKPEAERYGICKIIPPTGWKCPCEIDMNSKLKFPTKLQRIDTLQQGQGFDDGKQYNIQEYKKMADDFYQKWITKHHPEVLSSIDAKSKLEGIDVKLENTQKDCEEIVSERTIHISEDILAKDYWDIVETSVMEASVEYANDLDTTTYQSGFPKSTEALQSDNADLKNEKNATYDLSDRKYYEKTAWNMNNIPRAPGSLLQYLDTHINGINVPWLYIGMLFATFCWHNEDNYFYSLNYNHYGASKQWYGVPGDNADSFEKVSKDFLAGLFEESPDLLHHMTTQISPSLLAANGVPIYKVSQEAGSFIVTFSKSFHAGFSYGFNIGEAVNFAPVDWLTAGREAEERYRLFARESVFSHIRLLFTLLENHQELTMDVKKILAREIDHVVSNELLFRKSIRDEQSAVRDVSNLVQLPKNDFHRITEQCISYDDMRQCAICKQVCTFTAIACECSRTKVSCMRHYLYMCKCSLEKKFLLAWANDTVLQKVQEEIASWKYPNKEKDHMTLISPYVMKQSTHRAIDSISPTYFK